MTPKTEMDLEDAANIHDGLAHPVRVAAYRVLRDEEKMPVSELRVHVSKMYIPVDQRNLQFHLHKLQLAGLVEVSKEAGRETVRLVAEVDMRVKKR